MKFGARLRSAIPLEAPLWKRLLAWIFLGGLTAAVAGFFVLTIAIIALSINLPDVRDFDQLAGIESTILYDRQGNILYTIHGEENRSYVPLSEISPQLQAATIAIEDDQFYEHPGFDLSGIGRAILYETLRVGRPRGGSTITQQLAKNAFLSPKRTYARKLKELILAIRLERAYDKKKILELYLNRIPYGNNSYGAEMASKLYFGKSASALTLGESAILASLPKAPSFYSPYGPNAFSSLKRELTASEQNSAHSAADLPEDSYSMGLVGKNILVAPGKEMYIPGRADVVLRRMAELGVIPETKRRGAESEIQTINVQQNREAFRSSQHFVLYVRDILEKQFGRDVMAQGGLKVYTTLDSELQRAAEKIVADQIAKSKELHGVSNAALFAMNPGTGEVIAMVGSADYNDDEAHGKVNHVFAKKQPGSSFKPIVYAKAFMNRFAPATVIYDTPTDFGDNYIPQNFEGQFRGPVTVRQALGQSRNLPALKAYFLAGEQDEIITLANAMGISSLTLGGDYGPPLAIGAGEVTLAEMVQAFSVFSANGIKRDYFSITKVLDREDNVLYERKPEDAREEAVLDPQAAYLINSILSDKSVYLGHNLDVAGHITAAKTGTSNDIKKTASGKTLPSDLWTLGYTPSLIAGVWSGNSDSSPTKLNADGYTVSAPMWAKFMAEALKNKPDESFPVPEGIQHVNVSKASGKLPSEDTPEGAVVSEVFASFSVPTEKDDIYQKVTVNEKDGLLPNKWTPAEYIKEKIFMKHHDPITDYPKWQDGIREWVKKHRQTDPVFPDFPPTEETTIFTEDGAARAPSIQILFPAAFSSLTSAEVPVEVSLDAPHGVSKVTYTLDDRKFPSATVRKAPYRGTVRLGSGAAAGKHIITARVYDKLGYVGEARVEFQYSK